VVDEQFDVVAATGARPPKTKEQLGSERVQNPHDPDATYAAKGTGDQKKEHVGYKVQVAETVNEAVLAPGASSKDDKRFGSDHFNILVDQRQAICPAGQKNSQCSRLEEQASGRVSYRFEWSTEACAKCPLRQPWIKADQTHRTLAVSEHHTVLQQRWREQKTEPFQQRMKHRNAIEGTQSELVRAHGLRRARYRGLAKVKLQNYFISGNAAEKPSPFHQNQFSLFVMQIRVEWIRIEPN